MTTQINLAEQVGRGYGQFWRCKKRYRIIKGGRGSKKSCTMALWLIVNMMKFSGYKDIGQVIDKLVREKRISQSTYIKEVNHDNSNKSR